MLWGFGSASPGRGPGRVPPAIVARHGEAPLFGFVGKPAATSLSVSQSRFNKIQHHLQAIQAEFRVKAAGRFPAENSSGAVAKFVPGGSGSIRVCIHEYHVFETIIEPFQLHLEQVDLLERLSIFGLALILGL